MCKILVLFVKNWYDLAIIEWKNINNGAKVNE